MPSVLTVALPRTSAGAGARRQAAGARFVPTPNPAAASAKTRARSARPTPSSVSRGRRSTLNAYRLPMGRLNTVAANTMRHARRVSSASLILPSLGRGDARSGDGARDESSLHLAAILPERVGWVKSAVCGAAAWDAAGGGRRRPPPAASSSRLGDAGLHGLDQLGRDREPVVLHRVLSRL